MLYQIRRNENLVNMPKQFTAKNWESAVIKLTTALYGNANLLKLARSKNLNLEAIARDMLVEIGKE